MNEYTGHRSGFVQFVGLGAAIISIIVSIAKFLMRHPFVLKMMIFTMFIALTKAVIDYIMSKASSYIISNEITGLLAYFGVLDGLSLMIIIMISGFGTKQILAFVRST